MIWNVVSVKIDINKKEANENIKELTAVANECVDALERLEKELGRFFVSPPSLKPSLRRWLFVVRLKKCFRL